MQSNHCSWPGDDELMLRFIHGGTWRTWKSNVGSVRCFRRIAHPKVLFARSGTDRTQYVAERLAIRFWKRVLRSELSCR